MNGIEREILFFVKCWCVPLYETSAMRSSLQHEVISTFSTQSFSIKFTLDRNWGPKIDPQFIVDFPRFVLVCRLPPQGESHVRIWIENSKKKNRVWSALTPFLDILTPFADLSPDMFCLLRHQYKNFELNCSPNIFRRFFSSTLRFLCTMQC